jgi:RND family efflux transporter MFP subunit
VLDQAKSVVVAAAAAVEVARADLGRTEALLGYSRIVAPFDGVVTARTTDVGALITAGSAGHELFVVSDTRRLRVYVNVPQVFATRLPQGTRASISVPERPASSYTAVVEAASGAVDAATGTTLVQLSVDNAAAELLPGGYADVRFDLADDGSRLHVPASALIFDRDGLYVATLDSQDRVALQPVTIARDDGSTVEIATGLAASDRVIETPPDGIAAGSVVRVVETAAGS